MQSSAVNVANQFKSLALYKQLYKHLRSSNLKPNQGVAVTLIEPYVEVLRNEFRQHMISDSKYCMEKDEMFFVADAFKTYVSNTQQTLELYARYNKGEKTTLQAANTVGLSLPKQYDGPNTSSK